MIYSYVCLICNGELDVERGVNEELTIFERELRCPGCGGKTRRLYTSAIVVPEGFH